MCRSQAIKWTDMVVRLLNSDDAFLKQEVTRWYSAPDARRWMGDLFDVDQFVGRLGRPAEDHSRREHVCASLGWVRFDRAGCPVAFFGGDVKVERVWCTLDDGSTGWKEIGARTLGFTYVVAPDHRGRGHGYELVRAVLDHPALCDVHVLSCSIDRDNDASLALIRKFSEFREDGDESDEKSLFFKYIRRSGATGRKVEALG